MRALNYIWYYVIAIYPLPIYNNIIIILLLYYINIYIYLYIYCYRKDHMYACVVPISVNLQLYIRIQLKHILCIIYDFTCVVRRYYIPNNIILLNKAMVDDPAQGALTRVPHHTLYIDTRLIRHVLYQTSGN